MREQIVNLQSNDAAKLWALPSYGHMVWNGPFQVGAGVTNQTAAAGYMGRRRSGPSQPRRHMPSTHRRVVGFFL